MKTKWRVKAGSDLSMVEHCINMSIVTGSVGSRHEIVEPDLVTYGKPKTIRWCEVKREPRPE